MLLLENGSWFGNRNIDFCLFRKRWQNYIILSVFESSDEVGFFSLNHFNYARRITVHVFDLISLPVTHPDYVNIKRLI